MPGVRGPLGLLERFGLARDVDRERSVVPALVPAGAAGLIVLLLDVKRPFGVGLGLVITILCLPLLAATLAAAAVGQRGHAPAGGAAAQLGPGRAGPAGRGPAPPSQDAAAAVLEPGGSA
jgi:hypothetical protein